MAAPYLPFKRLIEDETGALSPGNFQDLESLLDQLASPPVFELGKPPIKRKFMPKPRVGSCPASHNRALLDEDALLLRQQALDLLARLPAVDLADLHALGDALAGTDPQRLAAFLDAVNAWLAQRLDGGRGDLARLNRLAEASEHINAAARDAEIYNLERKPLVFNVFGLLAEATRG